MKYYRYKTRIGTFYIKQKKDDPKIWQLWIDDEILGSYTNPKLAADDVYTQHTGYYEWDRLDTSPSNPHDLTEWELINK